MKKILISIIILLPILIISYFYYSIFIYKKDINKDFVINQGENTNLIISNLKKQGIINGYLPIKVYLRLKPQALIASNHTFMGKYNIAEILTVLGSQNENSIKVQKLTLIEGWNKYDISKYLAENLKLDQDYILKFIESDYKKTQILNKFLFLKEKSVMDLEGFIFPDTYEIYQDSSIEEIFIKILENFNNKVIKTYSLKDYDKLYNIVKIASLIEKEAKLDIDRPLVSSVIYNRLNNSMKLDIDATIIYFTQNRNNVANDKYKESPYNTYKNKGLPIGAISNPGIKSIEAAINPKNSNYFYYINKSNGEAVFAKTLEEHNRNVEKYLK